MSFNVCLINNSVSPGNGPKWKTLPRITITGMAYMTDRKQELQISLSPPRCCWNGAQPELCEVFSSFQTKHSLSVFEIIKNNPSSHPYPRPHSHSFSFLIIVFLTSNALNGDNAGLSWLRPCLPSFLIYLQSYGRIPNWLNGSQPFREAKASWFESIVFLSIGTR